MIFKVVVARGGGPDDRHVDFYVAGGRVGRATVDAGVAETLMMKLRAGEIEVIDLTADGELPRPLSEEEIV